MYLAALAALPIIQKLEQGLVDKVASGLASLFSPSAPTASGQNVPSQAQSGSANSAQPAAARPLSTGMNAALIAMQQQQSRPAPLVGGYRAAGGATSSARPSTTSLKV